MKKIKKVINFVQSVPTRLAARKEYNQNTYDYNRVGGDLFRTKKKKPITYNKASTGIR